MSDKTETLNLDSGILNAGKLTLIGQLVRASINILSQVILTIMLTASDFGVVAMTAPIVALAQAVSSFGIPQLILQRKELKNEDINTLFYKNVVFSLIIFALVVCLAPVAYLIYSNALVSRILPISALSIFFASVCAPFASILIRAKSVKALIACEVSGMFLGSGLSLILAALGSAYWSIVFGQVFTAFLTGLFLWLASPWKPGAWSFGKVKDLSQAGHLTSAAIAGQVNMTADTLLVGAVLGDVALGLYDRAWRFVALPLAMIVSPLGRVIVPYLVSNNADKARYISAVRDITALVLTLTCPIFAAGALYATPLIDSVFGARWSGLSPVFFWVCVGAFISPVNSVCFWVMASHNETARQMRMAWITMFVNISAYILGVFHGIETVAAFSALSVWIIQTPILIMASSHPFAEIKKVIFRVFLIFVVCGAGQATFSILLTKLVHSQGGLLTMVQAILSCFVFWTLLAASKDGRHAMRTILGNLWPKKMR